jgi:hypothetical protein
MNTIYLVTPSFCHWEGKLEGFATDAEGIEQIVQDRYLKHYHYLGRQRIGPINVQVDMSKFTVFVRVPKIGHKQTYYIREIGRKIC